jgi:hypothetical protein
MQETWSFAFPKTATISEQIVQILEAERKELGIFLSYYYRQDGAVAENVRLKGKPELKYKSSGRLVLDFDLVHFNACLAIHEQKREEIEITFELDAVAEVLKLTGPYWPERGMDEI